jgi:hypothetical protein
VFSLSKANRSIPGCSHAPAIFIALAQFLFEVSSELNQTKANRKRATYFTNCWQDGKRYLASLSDALLIR